MRLHRLASPNPKSGCFCDYEQLFLASAVCVGFDEQKSDTNVGSYDRNHVLIFVFEAIHHNLYYRMPRAMAISHGGVGEVEPASTKDSIGAGASQAMLAARVNVTQPGFGLWYILLISQLCLGTSYGI